MAPRQLSIAVIVVMIIVTVETVFLSAVAVVGYRTQARERWAYFNKNGEESADQMMASLVLPMWNFDRSQIQAVLASPMGDPEIAGVVIHPVDADDPPIAMVRQDDGTLMLGAAAAESRLAQPDFARHTRTIRRGDEVLGTVTVVMTPRPRTLQLRSALYGMIVVVVGMGLVLVLSLAALLWRIVLKPLKDLERYANSLHHGEGGTAVGSVPAGLAPQPFFGEIEVLRVAMTRMITEKTQLLSREKAARIEAERVSRVKDDFLMTVSHELRTPLTAVLGWAELLRSEVLSREATAAALDTIIRNAKIETQLVSDILEISSIVTGRLQIAVEPVALDAVIRLAIEAVELAALAKGVTIDFVSDHLPDLVLGDPLRLRQVFWNLLTNSVKFTPAGGSIVVRLSRSDDHAVVAVTDTGIGVGPEFLPRVFQRFSQADGSTTRCHGGLGIGLALVQEIVQAHGGSVDLVSAGLGLGTLVTVQLPLGRAAPSNLRAEAADCRSPSPATLRQRRRCTEAAAQFLMVFVNALSEKS